MSAIRGNTVNTGGCGKVSSVPFQIGTHREGVNYMLLIIGIANQRVSLRLSCREFVPCFVT